MAKMDVIWDGYGLGNPHSGVYRYAAGLLGEISELGVKPQIIQAQSNVPPDLSENAQIISMASKGLLRKVTRAKVVWPQKVGRILRSKRSEFGDKVIYHGLCNSNIPYGKGFHKDYATVLTMLDIIPLLPEAGVSSLARAQMSRYLPLILPKVDRITCISQWSKDTLLERFPYLADRTTVSLCGFPKMEPKGDGRVHQEGRPVSLLMVSRFEHYKNFRLLGDVVLALKDKGRLILVTDEVGKRFMTENFGPLLKSGGIEALCGVGQAELKDLYNNSDVYVQTSRYEGFCLPASEALSHRVPVVFQMGSGIDEVVGSQMGVGIEFGQSPARWAEVILETARLARDGHYLDEAENFVGSRATWGQAARDLNSLYRELL